MINYKKDNFDESLEDIMKSVNKILNGTGEGFETNEIQEDEESEIIKKRRENYKENSQ